MTQNEASTRAAAVYEIIANNNGANPDLTSEGVKKFKAVIADAILKAGAEHAEDLETLRTYQRDAADRFQAVVRQRDRAEEEAKRLRGILERMGMHNP